MLSIARTKTIKRKEVNYMLLYIDGTVRNESRTRELADYLAGKISDNVEYLRLCEKNILPMDTQTLSVREKLCNKKDFDNPYFVYAKQFVKADTIILAAPYWDLSFPSIVKAYLENICVVGLTFSYSSEGIPVGHCKARKLYYVTTAGGKIINDAYGYGYTADLAKGMFGIKEVQLIKAENLDIIGSDVNGIMLEAKKEIDKLF